MVILFLVKFILSVLNLGSQSGTPKAKVIITKCGTVE
jgi:hypothetical protein